jgi:uncharacterized protein (DUF433 family)
MRWSQAEGVLNEHQRDTSRIGPSEIRVNLNRPRGRIGLRNRRGKRVRPHHSRPKSPAGRATIRGLRISVAHVVNLVAKAMTAAQIVEELPDLEEEDVRQALGYAAALARDEVQSLHT